MRQVQSVRLAHRQHVTQKMILPAVFLTALLAAVLLCLIIGGRFTQNGNLFGGETSAFTVGWRISDGTNAEIPGRLAAPGGGVTLSNTLPGTLEDGAVLFLRTSYQSLTVTAGGERLYSWEMRDKAMLNRPFGLCCYVVPIPADAAGQPVFIRLQPNQNGGGSVQIRDIRLGSALAVASSLVLDNLDTVVLFFVLLFLCVLLLIVALLFRKRSSGFGSVDLLYLSLFIVLAAVWMITDSELALFFTRSVVKTVYVSLFSLMLMPVPLLLFVQRFVRKYARLLHGLASLVLLNFFVCTLLALLGVADLIQTLFTTHILSILTCVTASAVSFLEYARHKRRELLGIPLGLGLFCILLIIEIIAFAVTGDPYTSVFFRIGLSAFIVCVGTIIFRRTFSELVSSKSYTNLTRSIPSGICRIESFETGKILFANEFYYKMFGYTPAEAKKAGFLTLDFTVLPEDLPAVKEKIDKNFAYNFYRVETEARHIKKNGDVIWVLSRYTLEPFGHGAITAVMIDITDRRNMEEQLRISEEEYRIATLHSNKMILRFDIKTRACYSQQDSKQIFGMSSVIENAPDSIIESGLVAQDSVPSIRSMFDAIFRGEREGSVIVSLFNRNTGEYGWYHFDFTSIFGDGDKPVQAIISFYDVTHQRQKELAFQRWQQSYNAIPKNATNYYEYNLTGDIFEHSEGGMIPPVPETLPRRLSVISNYIVSHYVAPEDAALWDEFMSRDRLLERYANGHYTDKTEFRRLSDGKTLWTSLSVQLIPDPYSSNVKAYFLLEDIDEQKQAEIVLQERSMRDSLTGLLNRGSFIEQFNEILRKSDQDTQHALIMLDIDNFKTINDTLGHSAGDALLVNIASKLKYALRSGDLCGRIGGDEFVIFLKNMNLGKPLESRVNDLCSLVCNEQQLGISVSASFGIAGFPGDGLTFEELYQKADIALYKAKSQGRGGFALYDPQLSFDDLSVSGKH